MILSFILTAALALKHLWTAPPPPYCNEQRECCLKPADCSILGFLPAERR